MRIVIEHDQPDEGQGTASTGATQTTPAVFDGGPAPAALLRQFGRLPEAGEQAHPHAGVRPDDRDGGEMTQNPLRRGESIATEHRNEEPDRSGAPRDRSEPGDEESS